MEEKLESLKDRVWSLAKESLDGGNYAVSRDLTLFAEQLAKHITVSAKDANGAGSDVAREGPIRIFAKYRGETHDAEFEQTRMSGSRGRCVKYNGEWLAASAAAMKITDPIVTNGWQFWKYHREDGSERLIDDFREQGISGA